MLAPDPQVSEWIGATVRDVPDYPIPGVLFKDIGPLLADGALFSRVIEQLVIIGRAQQVSKIAGIEARGFIFAAPVAAALGVGFVPVRKVGKLPGATHLRSYALEYGEATLEIQQDVIGPGERVLLIDDVLATGGTAAAAAHLIDQAGGLLTGFATLIELTFLAGRAQLPGVDVSALLAL